MNKAIMVKAVTSTIKDKAEGTPNFKNCFRVAQWGGSIRFQI